MKPGALVRVKKSLSPAIWSDNSRSSATVLGHMYYDDVGLVLARVFDDMRASPWDDQLLVLVRGILGWVGVEMFENDHEARRPGQARS